MVSCFTIKKGLYRNLEVLCLFLLLSSVSFGQLAGGTYTIDGTLGTSGTNFLTFTSAIAALNTGITGPVTFNVTAGQTFPENPPAINIPSGNISSNPIIFQKSGGGADPVITYTGGTSGALDGIIVLSGTSYITFNGIDLTDNSVTNYAEWGYALLKQNATAPFNGCQNDIIENCTITMNKLNTQLSYGIYSGNHISAAITSLTLTTVTDAMNNCTFQNNTIKNVFTGIYICGFNSAPVPYTLYDQNNVISGNTINDVGGTAGAGSKCSKGIFTAGQNNFSIINNIIDNTASSTAYAIMDSLIGIYSYALATTGVGVNVNISNNTISLRSSSTSKLLIGIFNIAGSNGTTNSINIKNNTIQNFITPYSFYGIYNTGGNLGTSDTVNISGDTIRTCNFGSATTPAASYGIWSSDQAMVSIISSNVIQSLTLGDGTWEFDAINHSGIGNYKYFNNNTIDSISTTKGTAYTPTIYGLKLAQGQMLATIKSNSIHDFTINGASTTTTSQIYGISDNMYPPVDSLYGNSIYNLNLGLQGTVQALFYMSGNTTGGYRYISNNIIHDIQNSSSGATASNAFGINMTGGCFEYYINNNNIYKISAAGATGKVYGIVCSSSAPKYYIINNIIANLTAPASTTASVAYPTSIQGLVLYSAATASGGNIYVYNNTIYLNATSTGTNFTTAGVYIYNTSPYEFRNKIIVNNSAVLGSGKAIVLWKASNISTTNSQYSNNNCYYVGTPSATRLTLFDGTNSLQDITTFKNSILISPSEGNSFSELPPFIDPTTATDNFNISTSTGSLCYEGGAPISTPVAVTTDIAGTTRSTTLPDVGAYEFSGTLGTDNIGPDVTFTPVVNTNSTTGVTLTATILDPSGVPTSGTGLPMIYWKDGLAGSWAGVQGVSLGSNQYSFTFGSGASGDNIYYCFVAQDNSSSSNVLCYPLAGSTSLTANPPAVATYPTTPFKFQIVGGISGSYNVGLSGDFATLTAAVTAFNASVMTGPVTFTLNSSYVSTSETFPIVINNNPGSSATNVLTIKPGVSGLTISGATSSSFTNASGAPAQGQALIIFNGTQYAVLDGSYNGTTSRDLTINNTSISTTYAQQVIAILSLGPKLGASGITIKNCYIKGGILGTSTSANGSIGICLGGTAQFNPSLFGQDNNNITITNNKISLCNYGIILEAEPWGLLNNITINNNTIGDPTPANSISDMGIAAEYINHLTISNNEILNVANGFDYYCFGIGIYTDAQNLVINNNYIHDINGTTTTHRQNSVGIYISDTSTDELTTNAQVYNNIIYSIKGSDLGAAMSQCNFGIFFSNTVNSHVYNNTVVLNGSDNSGGTQTANVISCLGWSGNTPWGMGMDIRDNILINKLTPSSSIGKSYALYVDAGGDPSIINYNDYVVSTSAQFNTGFWGTKAYYTANGFRDSVYGGFNLKSVSDTVNFTSNYRIGASNGDPLLMGIPIPGITTDIDGNPRNLYTPYMGASEGLTPLPVELSSFVSNSDGRNVVLNWETKTEQNSNKFEIESSLLLSNKWTTNGVVNGSGNSNSPKQYSYTAKNLQSGKYQFRLKMIDNDGTFEYSKIIETDITLPKNFMLSQNYPNPFNPSTKIDYQLPVNANVKIEIYNIIGQKVADLINEDQAAGFYTIEFSAGSMHKNLTSGVYIYRLTAVNKQAGVNYTNLKKMIMLK